MGLYSYNAYAARTLQTVQNLTFTLFCASPFKVAWSDEICIYFKTKDLSRPGSIYLT